MRIAIVDDDPLVRIGLRAVLSSEDGWEVVAEAGDGEAAVGLASGAEPPDLILMDIRMPGMDGLEATRRIVARDDAVRVLVLTTFEVDEYVFEAMRAGASGFVVKRIPPKDLIEAVRIVASGESLLFPASTRRSSNGLPCARAGRCRSCPTANKTSFGCSRSACPMRKSPWNWWCPCRR